MQQCGRLQQDGRTEKPCPADKERAHTSDHAIPRAKIGCALAATIQDEQLMANQHRFCQHTSESARLRQPDQGDDQMDRKDKEVAHSRNRTKARKPLISSHFKNSPVQVRYEPFKPLRPNEGNRRGAA